MTKTRDFWLDHAKGVLIILVVFGHFFGEYSAIEGNIIINNLYTIIYFFHMPLFILLTGYFYNPNRPNRVISLFVIYLIWQVLNDILNAYFYDYQLFPLNLQKIANVFDPNWTLWYLLSVVIWMTITPYVLLLRRPALIIFLQALVVGAIIDVPAALSLRRMLMFYPFYIIGYYARKNNWLHSTSPFFTLVRRLSWPIVIVFIIGLIYLNLQGEIIPKQFFMKYSYYKFGYTPLPGMINQIILYASMLLFSLAFLNILPKKKEIGWLAEFGRKSLYIYLTHTLFIRLFKDTFGFLIGDQDIPLLFWSIVGTIFYLAAFKFLELDLFFRPIIQPKLNWLFKKSK